MDKQTIMIVDDEPLNIRMLGKLFSDEYQVLALTSGEEVVSLAESDHGPDLILLDVVMPDMDGHEVCRLLKSNERTKDIPVIFITSRDSDTDEVLGFQIGASDYITKPFRPEVTVARVKAHLELKKYRDLLKDSAYMDGLTGIANRRRFDDFIEESIGLCSRNGLDIAVGMIDIDYFKRYNDYYGHQYGDDCLRDIARALAHSVQRKGDLLARYGGEEFVFVLRDVKEKGLKAVLERLIMQVQTLGVPHETSPISDIVTVSVGAVLSRHLRYTSPDKLIKEADRLLYQAKEDGRNNYVMRRIDDSD